MVDDVNGIKPRQPGDAQRSGASSVERPARAEPSASSRPARSDDVVVELNQASQLESEAARLASESPVDSARVAELRQRLQSGDYQLSPDRIAQKLVDQETQFR